MLVEDESDIAILFKMILESEAGLKVDSFNDPFSSLNNFRPGLYELIMIDIVLPKMNGFELCKNIRKLDDKVKICFLTVGEMYYEEVRKRVFPELEADCYIRKPVANEDLIRRINDILKI
jgi:DNA-binding response OmpR family regulator